MKYIEPDFFKDFECTASKCSRSCCIGWEIDIDGETAAYYRTVRGKTGRKLRECIAWDREPHFILAENDRCPFLNKDNLCELILKLGEDALCDICREHPRFYNCTSGREEAGLGLCCEEAVRLLLSQSGRLKIAVVDDGENDEDTPQETELYEQRQAVMDIIGTPGRPLYEKMADAAALCGKKLPEFDMHYWGRFYMGLERLSAEWTEALEKMCGYGASADIYSALNDNAYERLTEYFIYRHFASAGNKEKAGDMLLFCFLSVAVICCLDLLGGDRIGDICMYSSEIEYSDENIGKIIEKIKAGE